LVGGNITNPRFGWLGRGCTGKSHSFAWQPETGSVFLGQAFLATWLGCAPGLQAARPGDTNCTQAVLDNFDFREGLAVAAPLPH